MKTYTWDWTFKLTLAKSLICTATAGGMAVTWAAMGRHLKMTVAHTDMANAIRFLSADAVQQANSGHPGMPMGMADVATVLFSKFLNFDPTNKLIQIFTQNLPQVSQK